MVGSGSVEWEGDEVRGCHSVLLGSGQMLRWDLGVRGVSDQMVGGEHMAVEWVVVVVVVGVGEDEVWCGLSRLPSSLSHGQM